MIARTSTTTNQSLIRQIKWTKRPISSHQPPTLVLGIETSCDDTSVAIVDSNRKIHALQTCNQNKIHECMGGIVPKHAALAHAKKLPFLIRQVLDHALLCSLTSLSQLDAVVVTRGPGLAPCLSVGLMAAKSICALINKPLIGVHHMEAHALTPRLTERNPPSFPYLSLLISGGHTLLILSKGVSKHTVLGQSLDDNIGDTFDKVARSLNLSWLDTGGGAGAALEREAAQSSNKHALTFPVPLHNGRDTVESRLHFSFSGLRTHVERFVATKQNGQSTNSGGGPLDPSLRADIAQAFQVAVTIHLQTRLKRAIEHCLYVEGIGLSGVVIAGGVAANKYIGKQLRTLVSHQFRLPVFIPPPALCTDNAAMIAWAGIERLQLNLLDSWDLKYIPKWPLSDL